MYIWFDFIFFLARIGDFSDEDEEFSSNDDGSDSEPMLEDHRERKASLTPNSTVIDNIYIFFKIFLWDIELPFINAHIFV